MPRVRGREAARQTIAPSFFSPPLPRAPSLHHSFPSPFMLPRRAPCAQSEGCWRRERRVRRPTGGAGCATRRNRGEPSLGGVPETSDKAAPRVDEIGAISYDSTRSPTKLRRPRRISRDRRRNRALLQKSCLAPVGIAPLADGSNKGDIPWDIPPYWGFEKRRRGSIRLN